MAEKSQKRKFSHFIEYAVVRVLFLGLSILPFRMRTWLLHWILRGLYRCSSEFRSRIEANLIHAFPEKDAAWRKGIAHANKLYLARMLSEFIQNPRVTDAFFRKWFVFDQGMEHFQKTLDQGGILILGHLGSWEWKGIAITHSTSAPLYVLAKRQKNPWANAFIEKNRTCQDIKIIYTDESPKRILKLLKQGALVAFIADQDAGPDAPFYEFFHRLAATYHGPAFFARLSRAPLFFVWSYHDKDGRLHLDVENFEPPDLDPKADAEAWDREFTKQWVGLLEKKVREYPEDYYWLHNRWKSQPRDQKTVNK